MAAVLSPAYCGGLTGWRTGLEARSRGRVHFGFSYDLLYNYDTGCTQQVGLPYGTSGVDTITTLEDRFEYSAIERIVVWVGTDLAVGGVPASVALGFGHAHAPWWSADWNGGSEGWWLGAQGGVVVADVLRGGWRPPDRRTRGDLPGP
jgi:hypothetical protein